MKTKIFLIASLCCLVNFSSMSQDLNSESTKKTLKSDPNVPIFEIKNDQNQTVFAVYPGGVKIFIDDQLKATGGGFTVGRLGTGKADGTDFLIVNPGDVRVNISDSQKATGGGFTVGRLGTGKAGGDADFLTVTPDSTRIYTVETSNKGFAAGKKVGTTGVQNFLNLSPQNYFIGHETGRVTTGLYNLFLGYQAGYNNTTGSQNFFAGYNSGRTNTSGYYNVFIGPESGLNNTVGQRNIFIGYRAGLSNIGNLSGNPPTIGHDNIYIGSFAGRDNADGEHNTLIGSYSGYTSNGTKNTFIGAFTGFDASGIANVFLGVDAGRNNTAGDNNTFIGTIAGNHNSGSNNTFLGYAAGYNSTVGNGNVFIGSYAGQNEYSSDKLYIDNSSTAAPLIFGDFNLDRLAFNGNVGVNRTAYSNVSLAISPVNQNYGLWVDAGSTTFAAQFNGDIRVNTTTYASDKRYKVNIVNFINGLDKVLALQGVTFDWDLSKYPNNGFSDRKQIGFIAQDVEQVLPEIIKEDVDGMKSVDYSKITVVLVEAVKEQQAQIDSMKSEIEMLKESLKELKNEMKNMAGTTSANK